MVLALTVHLSKTKWLAMIVKVYKYSSDQLTISVCFLVQWQTCGHQHCGDFSYKVESRDVSLHPPTPTKEKASLLYTSCKMIHEGTPHPSRTLSIIPFGWEIVAFYESREFIFSDHTSVSLQYRKEIFYPSILFICPLCQPFSRCS